MDARGGGIGAGSLLEGLKEVSPADDSVGIVFGHDRSDSKAGTVYGDVTLQDDLTIGAGESLTIPEGSSLDTNGKLTNNGTIINNGTLTGSITGKPAESVAQITVQPKNATVTEGETASFTVEANGENLFYQWQQKTTDSESDWADIICKH